MRRSRHTLDGPREYERLKRYLDVPPPRRIVSSEFIESLHPHGLPPGDDIPPASAVGEIDFEREKEEVQYRLKLLDKPLHRYIEVRLFPLSPAERSEGYPDKRYSFPVDPTPAAIEEALNRAEADTPTPPGWEAVAQVQEERAGISVNRVRAALIAGEMAYEDLLLTDVDESVLRQARQVLDDAGRTVADVLAGAVRMPRFRATRRVDLVETARMDYGGTDIEGLLTAIGVASRAVQLDFEAESAVLLYANSIMPFLDPTWPKARIQRLFRRRWERLRRWWRRVLASLAFVQED